MTMSRAALTLLLSMGASRGLQDALQAGFSAATCDRSRTVHVLFVGNSYTYVNNVPHLVEAIAASLPGPCVESSMIASGGATLAAHWAADSVTQRIRAGHWTSVVLQDQSTFGEQWWVDGRPRVGTSGAELAEFAGRFASVVRAANARPVLLAHWSDDGAPVRDQQALDYAFARTARATGSTLSPVGEAIKRMRVVIPSVTPYFADGHHLSEAGSYLEALVLYATLVDHSPLGAARHIEGPAVELNRGVVFHDSLVTLVDIPDSVATVLQRIAAAIHSERRGRIPSVRRPPPLADEFPKIEAGGGPLNRDSLSGRWRGTSTVLPTPGNQAAAVELVLHSETGNNAVPDSMYVRAGQIEFAGPVTLRIEGTHAVVHGTVTPRSRVGRAGPSTPFTIDLRAVLRTGVISGVATMHQVGTASMPSFDAVGRLEIRRTQGDALTPPLAPAAARRPIRTAEPLDAQLSLPLARLFV
ncbi:MAG TPA: hypothetical protein VHE78_12030 [Gemmatimonadaceae bacterium]|nr:hypothetical protein [Gemmatimonadaceae bacterium]